MKINKLLSFLLVGAVFSASPVMASDNTLTRETEYVSEDKNAKADDKFEEIIKEKEQEYKLKDIKYEVVKEEPVMTTEEVTTVIETDAINDSDGYVPEGTMEKDGVTYKLTSTSHEEVFIEKGWEQKITGYTDYGTLEEAQNAPKTKSITAKNDITGEDITKDCDFVGVEEIPASDWEDTYIDITFISYDALEFEWNGITVEKNEDEPLKGYEKELLESVGADTTNFVVNSISWKGKSYKNDDGVICRDARAEVQKKVSKFRANYEGTVTKESIMGKVYKLTYTGEKEVASDKTEYTIKAVATYDVVDNTESKPPVLQITLGVLILIIVVIGITMAFRKKQ